MNGFQEWVRRSREQQRRAPERYLAAYPELMMDETHVFMTQDVLERIERECGRYDGTFPTGVYLGKMFLRGECLCWFGISKIEPMTASIIQYRTIQVIE